MRSLLRQFLNAAARRKVFRNSDANIAADAKVNYRGISTRPPSRLSIGRGSIFEGAILSDRVGSQVVIGENTFIGNSTIVSAERVRIGDDVLISWGCVLADHDSHSLEWSKRSHDVRDFYLGEKSWADVSVKPIAVCNKAWIGFNVIVLKGVTIGEGAVVAAGSVVTKDVADYTLVAGNPARFIRCVRNGK